MYKLEIHKYTKNKYPNLKNMNVQIKNIQIKKYEYTNNKNPFQNARTRGDPHTHSIQRVQQFHEGLYTCVVGNGTQNFRYISDAYVLHIFETHILNI